jgi:LysM repeat protein
MTVKVGAAALAIILLVLLLQGTIFGGGDGPSGSIARRGSIPTATPPANLPEPLLLGEARATGSTAPAGGEGTYVVKSGDTISGIATSLNIPADQLAAWTAEVLRLNGIADARLLTVGQTLRLPRTATATPAPRTTAVATPTRTPVGQSLAATPVPAAATPRPTIAATGGGGTYTVAPDDFPLTIAAKLGVPEAQQTAWVEQLIALNNLNPNAMSVGTVLVLPAGTPSGGAVPAPTATRIP